MLQLEPRDCQTLPVHGIQQASVSFEDVAVHFTQDEWALLDSSQKSLYRDVMLEICRSLATIGNRWEKENVEDHYKNPWRNMSGSMSETPCERTEDDQVEETLTWISNLHASMTVFPGLAPYESHICGKASTSHSSSDRHATFLPCYKPRTHQEAHNGKTPYQYKECGKNSVCAHGGSPTMGKFYECNICGKALSSSTALQRHELIHTERFYECTYCGKAFRYPKYLRLHERIHTGEKPYECKQCGKAFRFPGALPLHEKIHTGEKPYKCKQCGKAFRFPGSLPLHEKIHTGEKPYECKQCGKAFRRHYHLQLHEKIHTGEKPYECKQCGKAFRRHSHLQRHERTHGGEKPFECE